MHAVWYCKLAGMDGNYIRVALVGFTLKYMHETRVVNNATFDNIQGRAEERPG